MPKNRIHKGKDGRYTYKVMSDGVPVQIKSRQGETKTSFAARCDELDHMASGTIVADTMDYLFYRWIEEHVKVFLSPSELRVTPPIYEQHVRPYLGHYKLSDITRADVYAVLARAYKDGASISYTQKIKGCVSRPYNWAVNTLNLDLVVPTQGLVFRPSRYVEDTYTAPPRQRAISDADLDRFFTAAETSKYCNYFRLLLLTGLRPSEGLGLQLQDIDQSFLHIRRGITQDGSSPLKTHNAWRDIPLTPEMREVLADQRVRVAFTSKQGWLFPSSADDGMPSMNAISCAFRKILKQTAEWQTGGHNGMKKLRLLLPPVNFTLYDFRHTFATRMAERGMNQKTLQMIMGHSSISTTLSYYVGITDTMLEDARDLMSM